MIKSLAISIIAMIFATDVYAAQLATVDIEAVEVRDGPGSKFSTVETISKNRKIAVSNLPTEGFFKVRTPSGKIGWIPSDSVTLGKISEDPEITEAKTGSSGSHPWEMRAFGGQTFFSMTDVNAVLGTTGFKTGYNFGAEVGYKFNPHIGLFFRGEKILKNTILQIESTQENYSFAVSSLPLMAGLQFMLVETRTLSADFAIFGGYALASSVSGSAVGAGDPTVFKASTLTGLAKADLNWRISRRFGFYVESGYRLLRTANLLPAQTGSIENLFQSNGSTVPISLNLSGFLAGIGLVVNL